LDPVIDELERLTLLSSEKEGEPFEFIDDRVQLRVPAFYKVVKAGWDKSKRAFNPQDADKRPLAGPPAQEPDPYAWVPNLSSGRR